MRDELGLYPEVRFMTDNLFILICRIYIYINICEGNLVVHHFVSYISMVRNLLPSAMLFDYIVKARITSFIIAMDSYGVI